MCAFSHHHAAAGMNVLPRQPPPLFADHEGHNVGDVFRHAESLERRRLLADLAEDRIGRHHGRVRVPGGDRIHRDPLGRQLVGQPFGELFKRPLAAEIRGGAGKSPTVRASPTPYAKAT